jgi:hypothetical protein
LIEEEEERGEKEEGTKEEKVGKICLNREAPKCPPRPTD